MAIPFLNNINLSDNQLLNAKLQVTSTAPTAAVGQIYFDSTAADETAKYYSNATDAWVSLKEYTFPAGSFITGTVTGTTPKPIITFDLSATGTPDATVYLRGDNAWAPISGIPGTYTWTVSDGSNSTPVASGETVTFSGTANEIEVAESGRTVIIGLPDDVTIANNLTVGGTGNFTGQVTIPILPVASTDAASKDYVDNAVVGGLVYQGGFDGSTGYVAGTTDYLDSRGTQIAVSKGWTYTVTVAGTFYGENVEVGDVLIAEDNLASGTGSLSDWTTVQNNIDLATDAQVGIGNVNIDGAGDKDGLSLAYASGTATVGLDINGLPSFSINPISGADLLSLEIPLYNGDSSDANEKIEVATLLSAASSQISYANTITDTATLSHGLNSSDIMVQLYDITTGETVYADVDRISTTQVTITFAATPTNSIRVLVQKIG
jgi:hypothetical protein